MKIFLISLVLVTFSALAEAKAVDFYEFEATEGVRIQTCLLRPNAKEFPGRRPVIFVMMGSGQYDTCHERTLNNPVFEPALKRGVAIFFRQKRGLSHDPVTGEYNVDNELYLTNDLYSLEHDAHLALEQLFTLPEVDQDRVAVWGGSEGTVVATHVARHSARVKEVVLISSMVEPFANLYNRQLYVLTTQYIFEKFDRTKNGFLAASEDLIHYFIQQRLRPFAEIDLNRNGQIDPHEMGNEILRAFNQALREEDDRFFMSDLGGAVGAKWIRSAITHPPLGPQILDLRIPVYLQHGVDDLLTLAEPVQELEKQALQLGKTNLNFRFYPGLGHALSTDVIANGLAQSCDRLIQ